MKLDRADTLLAATLLISLAAVGGALVSQHVYDIMPCPWCVLQRLIFVLIALAAGLGLLWPGANPFALPWSPCTAGAAV